jgi:4-amino-4-deoxy-L-arabinose transferase-like glycosyltransferase
VRTLRLPGLALGCGLILLTWVTARRVSLDPWTPVVAAAVAGSVPKFVFLSAVVNNDNLVAFLGAALTLVAIAISTDGGRSRRKRAALSVLLGLLTGAIILAKVTGAFLAVPAALAVAWAARDRREGVENLGLMAVAAIAVCGWWFARNAIWYGDPLATEATRDYLGILVEPVYGTLEQAFVRLPQGVWKSAWYNSGWNQFDWWWPLYAPFWLLAGAGVGGFALMLRRREGGRWAWLLAAFALSAIATVWAIGLTTPQTQARVGFGGLAAVACLVAVGFERLRLPVAARFALPVLGFGATAAALIDDVLNVY